MRPSNLQFAILRILRYRIVHGFYLPVLWCFWLCSITFVYLDFEGPEIQIRICILCKLVRTFTLHYSRDLFLGVSHREREKVADWGCGCNLVLDFVFGACQHSLSRLYLPNLCVSHQPYDMIVGDNRVNMIYCQCYCNTNVCILFYPYRDTGGIDCKLYPVYCLHQSLSPTRGTGSILWLCNLPCCLPLPSIYVGTFVKGEEEDRLHLPHMEPFQWSREGDLLVLIGCELGLLHTNSDFGGWFLSDPNFYAIH